MSADADRIEPAMAEAAPLIAEVAEGAGLDRDEFAASCRDRLAPTNLTPASVAGLAVELSRNGRPAMSTPLEQANALWRGVADDPPAILPVLRRGDGGDANYTVPFENGRRFTCTLAAMFDPRRLRPLLIEASGLAVADGKARLDPLATALVRAAEDDTRELEQVREWIAAFLRRGGDGLSGPWSANVEHDPLDPDDRAALAFRLREPDPPSFRGTDGRLYLRLARLREHVQRIHGERLTERQLAVRLRRVAGFESEQLQVRDADAVLKGRYWRSPPGFDPDA